MKVTIKLEDGGSFHFIHADVPLDWDDMHDISDAAVVGLIAHEMFHELFNTGQMSPAVAKHFGMSGTGKTAVQETTNKGPHPDSPLNKDVNEAFCDIARKVIEDDTGLLKAAINTLHHLKYTYRGGKQWKPPIGEPEVIKPEINWDHVDPKFNYLAIDHDGTVFLYKNKPIFHEKEQAVPFWCDHSDSSCEIEGFASFKDNDVEPKHSLICRPGIEDES